MNDSLYTDVSLIFETMRSQGRKLRWLADETGVSLSYVTKMQNGDRPARLEWAERAARALGLPPSLFLPRTSRSLDDFSSEDGRTAVA